MTDLQQVLERTTTIAVVGMSTDPDKAAQRIPLAMHERGFTVLPVHPDADEVAGLPAVPSLGDLPEAPDVVDVFRPAEEAPDIAREAVAVGAKVLWLQAGITSPEARRIAEDGGLTYVEDRCIGAESARYDVRK